MLYPVKMYVLEQNKLVMHWVLLLSSFFCQVMPFCSRLTSVKCGNPVLFALLYEHGPEYFCLFWNNTVTLETYFLQLFSAFVLLVFHTLCWPRLIMLCPCSSSTLLNTGIITSTIRSLGHFPLLNPSSQSLIILSSEYCPSSLWCLVVLYRGRLFFPIWVSS